ncbi:MAG: ATP-binding protein [Saprospiraceae bacterium]|nr:ATP-binding protein [Saprospiraceae bacterium]
MKRYALYSIPVLVLLLQLFGQQDHIFVLLATAALALVAAFLFHSQAAILTIEYWRTQKRWAVTGLSYFAIITGATLLTWYIQRLALAPEVSLQLQGFYRLQIASIAGLGSIVLLLVAFYLISHRLMLNIAVVGLSKYPRLLALGIAIAIAAPIIAGADLQFPLLWALLAIVIYILLFDLFIDYQIPGITWFITWIVLFAIYIAILLYRYHAAIYHSLHDWMSLFSCAFLALILVVMLLFLTSSIFPFLRFPVIEKPSLRNRVQVLVVWLTLLIFGVVGATTVVFFQNYVADWEKHIYNLIDWLIKSYAFLLLAIGVLAIAIANSITRPIVRIGEKLKTLQLGKNEPILWRSQDEIGELITEYNRMIAKLEDSTEQLKQSERESAWREMAKQVAHEIKNPLTPMKLSIQYLQHAAKTNPQEAEAMMQRVANTLIEQIDGLARIATEFSNFAQMSKPQNEAFTLNEVVQSVFNLFAENPEGNTKFELNLPDEPLKVFADKDHVIRVLNNLIKNALQAIPDGRRGRIRVTLSSIEESAILQVEDNGIGIPTEMQEKVFQPNFTTKSSGTGLGLAMSKNIVEATGGKIWLESKVGEGTRFFVALPKMEL